MKKIWEKIINFTGIKYFLVSISGIPVLIVGGYAVAVFINFLQKFLHIPFDDAEQFLVWGMSVITVYTLLSLQGIIVLFRTSALKNRVWVWIGLAINLFILYYLLFAGY